ncbi:GNAT family N-acetyltransferase [Pseudarthrobacter albicanus]|uniref:GNAT family N-acetyltransferase n=1 Tax=Pseudarthrobacter albicanus TaxID=2823873 RepID=UPI001FE7AC0B|nr:GNAT family N-acetyltransferase [Pseudarthrobacter albicanus]
MIIREATAEDLNTLTVVGLEAMNWSGEARFTYEQFMNTPELSHYPEGWPRSGDFGVVAETADGTPVGAAWGRIFAGEDAGYGFVAPDIPELTIGVLTGHRGTGAGNGPHGTSDWARLIPWLTRNQPQRRRGEPGAVAL